MDLVERLREWRDSRRDLDEVTGAGQHPKTELITEAADRIEALEAENGRLRRCLLPVQMTLAQAECVDEPLPDDAVVLHFMGSGASDQVTAGEIRAALGQ